MEKYYGAGDAQYKHAKPGAIGQFPQKPECPRPPTAARRVQIQVNPMGANTSNTVKASDTIAGPTFLLGVDTHGRHHVYSRRDHAVRVVDGTELAHVTTLGDNTDPSKWVTFIDDQLCGWTIRNYAFTPAYRMQKLAEAIA